MICGPSGIGKTEYIRSLFGPGEVLELSFGGITDIHLAGYDHQKTKCIFWDELEPSVVTRNRNVFQHPATMLDLGHSPTGAHVKRYWINSSVSIIASNTWMHDIMQLKACDKEWIDANSIVCQCTWPLFELDADSVKPLSQSSLTPMPWTSHSQFFRKFQDLLA